MESRFPAMLALWLGRELHRGKYEITGSNQAWTPDLGDHFGDLETNLATLVTKCGTSKILDISIMDRDPDLSISFHVTSRPVGETIKGRARSQTLDKRKRTNHQKETQITSLNLIKLIRPILLLRKIDSRLSTTVTFDSFETMRKDLQTQHRRTYAIPMGKTLAVEALFAVVAGFQFLTSH
ncbi:hypothetical protein AVEN_155094-1 [Araneus ventricosus]|uniref:Uncharacterized protein n=1 Tax=Araneus ventricosus TaxID=182803 RepID=A0A4Y2AA54_ARAVE|nr:hypothetical protein AVEN_155094-1 [Araneus ventricosus]